MIYWRAEEGAAVGRFRRSERIISTTYIATSIAAVKKNTIPRAKSEGVTLIRAADTKSSGSVRSLAMMNMERVNSSKLSMKAKSREPAMAGRITGNVT